MKQGTGGVYKKLLVVVVIVYIIANCIIQVDIYRQISLIKSFLRYSVKNR